MGRKSIAVSEETHERLARLAEETGRTIGGALDILSRRAEADDGEIRLHTTAQLNERMFNTLVRCSTWSGLDGDGIDNPLLNDIRDVISEVKRVLDGQG